MLRANSSKQQKRATTTRTRRAATRERRRHYRPTVNLKNTVCTVSTQKKKIQNDRGGRCGLTNTMKTASTSPESLTRAQPKSVNTTLTLELYFPWLAYRLR
jgi:hypothetical protein